MSAQSWQSLLRAPHPCDHVVQLYKDEGFLIRAVTHFMSTGLAAGEAGVLIATPEHVAAVTRRLAAAVDVSGALARDQLVLLDAETCLTRFMIGGMPDRAAFLALANGVLDRVRAAGHRRVRLFGEMVNLLWEDNLPATVKLEALWSEVLVERQVCLLCAYRLDNFDHRVHRGLLHRISRSHSHMVPVEDYERLDAAVDRAYRDVFGDRADTVTLRELLVAQPSAAAAMPAAQAALVALRDVRGDIADDVLARARTYYDPPLRHPPTRPR
jgi:hypothetical protein